MPHQVRFTHVIKKGSQRKDGTFRVSLRVNYGKARYFPVTRNNQGIYLTEKQFKQLGRSVKLDSISKFLTDERQRVLSIIQRIQPFNWQRFEQLYLGGDRLSTLFQAKIDELNAEGKFSTAKSYEGAMRSFVGFRDEKIDNIGEDYLNEYVASQKGFPSTYLRYLRHICRKNKNYAFEDFQIKSAPKTPKPLSLEELKKLMDFESAYPSFQRARDFWLISYYGGGMNTKDWIYLQKDQIINGVIFKPRSKNQTPITVPLMYECIELMNRYRGSDPLYFFDVLSSDLTDLEKFTRYKTFHSNYRRDLERVRQILEIETKLLPYNARHTHANVLLHAGVNREGIQRSMSHQDSRSTEIYMGDLNTNKIREIQSHLRIA